MIWKKTGFLLLIVVALTFFNTPSRAERVLTRARALAYAFPGADRFVVESVPISSSQVNAVRKGLGYKSFRFHTQEGDDVSFFFALQDEKKIGAAYIGEERGRWGPIEFVVCLDIQGKVLETLLTRYEGKYDRFLPRVKGFLKQYVGKGVNDPVEIGKDIDTISGATLSCSMSAGIAIKKAMLLYDQLFLK